jgi:hypothetical protein
MMNLVNGSAYKWADILRVSEISLQVVQVARAAISKILFLEEVR